MFTYVTLIIQTFEIETNAATDYIDTTSSLEY